MGEKKEAKGLTMPLLQAMASALDVALAGDGFDGGDFTGESREHYERALDWISREIARRKGVVSVGEALRTDDEAAP